MRKRLVASSLVLGAMLAAGTLAQAQVAPQPFFGQRGAGAFRRPGAAGQHGPLTGESAAPIDLTGYWSAIVTEDWRWRMLTAPTGDTASVPLNAAGLKIAREFDRARYGGPFTTNVDCRAYYMAGLMRMPTRLHITWASPNELRIQSDWGEQTRTLYFQKSQLPQGGPTPQGSSYAEWVLPVPLQFGMGGRPAGVSGKGPAGGYLKVVTDNLMPGWLRRNGVPYGSKTHVTEYFQTFVVPASGRTWFDVTTVVNDPEYLLAPFITSSDFRKEPNGSKWSPHPCVNVQGG